MAVADIALSSRIVELSLGIMLESFGSQALLQAPQYGMA